MKRFDQRFLWLSVGLGLASPGWARPGGGSSYRGSSSPSNSRTTGSRPSGSSYHSSSRSNPGQGFPSQGPSEPHPWIDFFVFTVVVVMLGGFFSVLRFAFTTGSDPDLEREFKVSDVLLTEPGRPVSGPQRFLLKLGLIGFLTLLIHLLSPGLPLRPSALVLAGVILFLLRERSADQKILASCARGNPPQLKPIFDLDANFSPPVFREFAVLLYCQALQERVSGFPLSRPYLSEAAAQALAGRSRALSVSEVVVGVCSPQSVSIEGCHAKIEVFFESNSVEKTPAGEQALIVTERWTFSRVAGALTRVPEGVSALACPGCGFTGEFPSSGGCPQCGCTNEQGQLDWVVCSIELLSQEPFKAHQAEGGGVEAGTGWPTILHPELPSRRREFEKLHPDFRMSDFETRIREVFLAINQAWQNRDWSAARPFESDALFRVHRYWIEDYLRKGQVNRLLDVQLSQVKLSNLLVDAVYESITVRIFASMIDFTAVANSGEVLFGDPKRPRVFSEYWTFIRRLGSKQGSMAIDRCPSCGAALDRINQAGVCGYCDSLVTRGAFGWVLSNIEQDESYRLSY